MSSRGKRQIIYVCNAIINDKIVTEFVEKESSEDAFKAFESKHSVQPCGVHGPFYRKRTGILEQQIKISFSCKKTQNGVYQGWNVKVMHLSNPPEMAWILYQSRTDNKPMQKPKPWVVRLADIEISDKQIP